MSLYNNYQQIYGESISVGAGGNRLEAVLLMERVSLQRRVEIYRYHYGNRSRRVSGLANCLRTLDWMINENFRQSRNILKENFEGAKSCRSVSCKFCETDYSKFSKQSGEGGENGR
jgi:hypothetical protein